MPFPRLALVSLLLLFVVLHAPTTCAVFTSATSVDTDDNAKIDAFDVVFDEPMNISTFVLSDFTVDGFTVVASSSLNTTTVRLEVDERIEYAYDGAATPNVNYTEGSLRTGAGGTPSTDSTVAIDGVAPRLVALYTELGVFPANLRLYFSEPVNSSLTTGEFVYTDTNSGGVGSIASLSDADGSDRAVTLVMNTFFRGSDNTDTIAVTADITDPTGNAALTGKTLTIPGETPTIDLVGADIVHRDTNGNGIADEIVMKANLPVDDSSVVTSGVFILELDGGDTYTISGFRTGGMVNDSVFIIDLDETGREPRTAASGAGFDGIAAISIGSANWKCEACASTSGFTEATGLPDTLGPVIVSATSRLPEDTVTITLSEPLDAATANTFFEYVNNAGGGATAIAAGTTNFSTGVGEVTLDAPLTGTDLGSDQVRFTSSVADAAGNIAASTAAETIENDDTTPPTITSATTVDTDSDGIADQLLIVMSEAILDSSFTLGDWDISDAGYSVTAFETDTADDDTFSLNITAPGTSGTDATPELVYTKGTFSDVPTNLMENQTITALDGIVPRLESVTTGDSDGNGKLDQLTLVFSEPMSDASIDTAAWSLSDDYQIDSHNSGSTANDATIVFVISKPSLAADEGDTDIKPTVDYNATAGSLADTASNELADITNADPADGAGPAIISVTGALPSDVITVTFSEPLATTATISDLTLTAVDTMALDSITNQVGAVLTITTTNMELDDFEKNGSPGSSLVAAADTLPDNAGNNASTTAPVKLQNTDSMPPTVTSVTTVDADGDGQIDGFVVVMDSLISDTTVNDSLILVSDSFTGVDAPTTLAGFTDTADDTTFYIAVTELGSVNTTLTPTVTFEVGSVSDLNGNALDTQDAVVSVDGVGPVIISATSQVTFTNIVITFSEPVYGDTGATGVVPNEAVTLSGSLNANVTNLSDENGADSGVDATVDVTFVLADFETSARIQIAAGTSCFDALSNACGTGVAVDLVNSDVTPPAISTVETGDTDADGKIDVLVVTFSEAVADSSLNASDFSFETAGFELNATNAVVTGDTADDNVIVININAPEASSTDATPTLAYTLGTLIDINGNLLANASVGADDKAAPIVLSITTGDSDGNGQLDQLTLLFSEAIDDGSVSTTPWTVSGDFSIGTNTTGDTADDATIVFSIVNASLGQDFDTDVTPTVSYVEATGTLVDAQGNTLADVTDFTTTDGAGPVIVSVTAALPLQQLTIVFNEPLAAQPDVSELTLVSRDTMALDAVTAHSSNEITVTTLNMELDDFDNATITPATGLADAAGNNASTAVSATLVNSDSTAPTVVRVVALDADGDGLLDGFRVEMSEPVRDSTINDSVITVNEGLLNLAAPVALAGIADTADDATFYISVTEPATIDTTRTPTVSFPAECLHDLNANELSVGVDEVSEDGMGAVVISASSRVSINSVLVTFSEAVFGVNNGTGALPAASAAFAGSENAQVSAITEDDGSDSAITITSNVTFVLADFSDLARVAVLANAPCFDVEGNACGTGHSVALENSDTTAPTVTSVTTLDADGNGKIDAFMVVVDEPVDDSTIDASKITVDGFDNVSGPSEVAGFADTPNDNTFYFTVDEASTIDTTLTPNVNFTAEAFDDINGVALDALAVVQAADGVGAVVISASSRVSINSVLVTFSEAVFGVNNGTGALSAASAAFAGSENAQVSAITEDDGSDSAITITSNVTFVLADFSDLARVAVLANTPCFDAQGNACGTGHSVALENSDTTAPTVANVTMQDTDGNGQIDTFMVEASEPVQMGSVNTSLITVDGFTVTGSTDDTVDAFFFLTVNELNQGVDTSSTPNVTFAVGAFKDINDVAFDTADDVTSLDGAGPVVAFASSEVGSDVLTVVFSEAVLGGSDGSGVLVAASVALTGARTVSITSLANDADGTDASVQPSLDYTFVLSDFENASNVAVGAGSASCFDTFGNACATSFTTIVANSDETAPTVTSVTTHDADGDGKIDGFMVQTSEPIQNTTIVPADITVDGFTVLGVTDTAVDNQFRVNVEEAASVDTTLTPWVNFDTGAFVDINGNAYAVAQNLTSADGVGPVVLSASSRVGLDSAVVVLSEAAYGANDGAAMNETSFDLAGTSAVGVINLSDGDGSDSEVTLELNSVLALEDFADLAVLAVAGAEAACFDAQGNACGAAAVVLTNTDTTAPSVLSITTVDEDSNGFIDRLQVVFSEPMVDSTILPNAVNFSVGGYTIESLVTGVSADDDTILINLSEGGSPDTAATPEVSLDGNLFQDLNGNLMVAADVTPADGAGPVVISATSEVGTAELVVVFSEPVGTAGGDLTEAAVTVTGKTMLRVDDDGDTGSATFVIASSTFVLSDFGSLEVVASPGNCEDRASPAQAAPAAATAVTLVNSDTTPPAIDIALTGADLDATSVQRIVVTFTDDIDPATAVLNNFAVSNPVRVVTGVSVSGAQVTLELQATTGVDTGSTPTVMYTAGSLADVNGNAAVDQSVQTNDRVSPAIVSALSLPGESTINVTFSEPVVGTLSSLHFTLTASQGGLTLASGDYTDGLSPVTVVPVAVSRAIVQADLDNSATRLAPVASSVSDQDGNDASDSEVTVLSDKQLTMEFARFEDIDGNGRVDRLRVGFSGTINAGSVTPSDFVLEDRSTSTTRVVSAVANVDDTLVLFSVTESTTLYDTGNSFDVVYTSGSLVDNEGTSLTPVQLEVEDTAPPVIVSATTRATLRVLTVSFSEPVFDGSGGALTVSDLSYQDTDGQGATTMESLTVVNNTMGEPVVIEVTMAVGSEFTVDDFGQDRIGAVANSVFDSLANPASNTVQATVQTTDTTAPTLVSAATQDADGNGRIDRFVLTFSEAMDDGSVNPTHWTLGSFAGAAIVSGDGQADDDETVVFSVTEVSSGFDTDATVTVSYSNTAMTDLNGNELAAVSVTSVDEAEAVVVSATGVAQSTSVLVTFSEPIQAAAGGGIDASALTLASPRTNSLIGVSGDGTDGTLTATLQSPLRLEDFDNSTVTIGPAADKLTDRATVANPASGTSQLSTEDTTPPTLNSAVTGDETGDPGKVDTIVLTFDEPLVATSVSASDFSVVGFPVDSVQVNGAGDVVTLRLTEGTEFDTAITPAVSYTGSSAIDLNGVALAQFSGVASTDGAGPSMLSATGFEGGTLMIVTFSEPVVRVVDASSGLAATDFGYTNANGAGASAVVGLSEADASDSEVTLTLNAALTASDLTQDSVFLVDGALRDGTGNSGRSGAGAATTMTNDPTLAPETSDNESSSSSSVLLFAGAGGIGLVLLIIVIVVVVVRKRRKNKQKVQTLSEMTSVQSAQSMAGGGTQPEDDEDDDEDDDDDYETESEVDELPQSRLTKEDMGGLMDAQNQGFMAASSSAANITTKAPEDEHSEDEVTDSEAESDAGPAAAADAQGATQPEGEPGHVENVDAGEESGVTETDEEEEEEEDDDVNLAV